MHHWILRVSLWSDVIYTQLEALERWDRSTDPPGVMFQPWLLLWKPAMTHGKGSPPQSSVILKGCTSWTETIFIASYFD